MCNFLKGIIVGIGGIAPGLSGSVLLVILGLYQKTINAIGTLFKDFKKNVTFLVPLFLGFGVGVILFSKIVDFLLGNYEMYTRFTFLGLVLGTIPLFYKEVKKEGFNKKYYIVMLISAIAGIALFSFNKDLFPVITDPNLFQSVLLGFAVAGSSIVPGVDSAVILSTLGLYELYVGSIADFNLAIDLAMLGIDIGASLEAKTIISSYCVSMTQEEKDSYILFLGRIVPEKGVHYLIDAYKNLNTDKKLVIAGGSSHTNEYLEKIKTSKSFE